ncbi:MAG: ABC transporter permease subunit [bacterium]
MFKSLIWKEWRENWPIVMIAIGAICLLTYLMQINREFNPGVNDVKIVFLFIPLFITIITANLFSTEFGHKTMPFLLTQPLSRSQIWIAKASFGFVLVLILTFGSGFGVYCISQLTPHPMALTDIFNFSVTDHNDVLLALALLYVSGLFIAVMVSNTIVAAFGSLLFAGFVVIFVEFITVVFNLTNAWYWNIWVIILVLLLSSYYVFTRPEILITKKRIKSGLSFVGIITLGYAIISVFYQSNYNDVFFKYRQISYIDCRTVIPSKHLLLASISKISEQRYSYSSRLCLISLDSPKQYTYLPRGYYCERSNIISPDQRYIELYNSRRFFGLVESQLFGPRIYLLDLTTRNIHRLPVPGVGLFKEIMNTAWSADDQRILYTVIDRFKPDFQTRIININTRVNKIINMPPEYLSHYSYEYSWTKDGNSFYTWYYLGYDAKRRQEILRLAQISLDGKILWQNTQYGNHTYPIISPDKNWLLYSQNTGDPSELRKVYLKNLATNESTEILSSPHIKSGFWSPDSKWIAISTVSTTTEYALWLVNLETKEKRVLVNKPANALTFRGWSSDSRNIIFSLWLSNKEPNPIKVIDIYSHEMRDFPFRYDSFYNTLSLPNNEFLITYDKVLYKVSLDGKVKQQLYP